MNEQTNLMDLDSFKRKLEEYVQSPQGELKPTVAYPEDDNKIAEIVNFRFANTKYGEKLVLDLRFDDGTEKVVFLGKMWTKDFIKFAGPAENWKGMKVRLIPVPQYNPSRKESVRKLFPNPVVVQQ